MSAPQDPRKESGFKTKRYEDRVIAMLGAIYEQLAALNEQTAPTKKPRKKDEQVG